MHMHTESHGNIVIECSLLKRLFHNIPTPYLKTLILEFELVLATVGITSELSLKVTES